MSQKKLKILIAILFTIFLVIVVVAIIISKKLDIDEDIEKKPNTNSIDLDLIAPNNTITTKPTNTWEVQTEEDEEVYKLQASPDTFSYFLMKQCLTNFYNASSAQTALNMLDTEVTTTLNINKGNISNLYGNFNNPQFCIDRIYKQKLDKSKDIYVVYHRLQKNSQSNGTVEETVSLIKIDRKNVTYSVYPYGYLKMKGYLELTQDDEVKVSNLEELTENEDNQYKTDLISKDDETCIKEFYDRFKFDIQFDVQGLYNKIAKEYKSQRFQNIESLATYARENRTKVVDSEVTKYKVTELNGYKEYVIVCDNNTYVFDANNLMNYTISLDTYTVMAKETKKSYDNSFPNAKSRYCIKRIMHAIEDKDYDFVYSKLDVIQKNNVYKNVGDLKKFIDNMFYEKTAYEIIDDYLIVSDDVYQYDIKIKDDTGKSFTYRWVTVTVTLKENEDFTISLNKRTEF